MLLQAGADVNVKNKNGQTAADITSDEALINLIQSDAKTN